MLGLVLLLPLALPVPQDPEREVPSPEKVAEALEELEAAYDAKDPKETARVLERAGEVPDARVVEAIAKGLKNKQREVVAASIQSLRWIQHPDAVEELHRAQRSNRTIKKDPELAASVLKAIGQHADPRSVEVLSRDVFDRREYASVKARVLGLGRIRDREALEALLSLMKRSAPRHVDSHMADFRLSLMLLTGTDQGPSSQVWQRWWNDVRKDYEVPPEVPELPRSVLQRWAEYWGLDRDYGRSGRREERGRDRRRGS